MNSVMLRAGVQYAPLPNGERMRVSSDDPAVRASIRRMPEMHAAMAGDTADRRMAAAEAPGGEQLDVTAKSPADLRKLRALGFYGMIADGDHHAT